MYFLCLLAGVFLLLSLLFLGLVAPTFLHISCGFVCAHLSDQFFTHYIDEHFSTRDVSWTIVQELIHCSTNGLFIISTLDTTWTTVSVNYNETWTLISSGWVVETAQGTGWLLCEIPTVHMVAHRRWCRFSQKLFLANLLPSRVIFPKNLSR